MLILIENFNLLKLIKSPLTENWKYFATRYCEGRQITTTLKNGFKKKVWLTNGASNLEELSIKTRNIFLRRLTEDFADMPDKTVTPLMNDLTKYLVEGILQEAEIGIVVLLPGGFKPPHGGHLDLAVRYSKLPNVSEVRILIGPKEREGITREQSIAVWNELLIGARNITVQKVAEDNPLLAAYKYIETTKPGTYALAASSKGEDYERVKKFVQVHAEGSKYHKTGVEVVELPINTRPLPYTGRTDGLNGKGVGSSTLRKDLAKKDYKNFKTNWIKGNLYLYFTKFLFLGCYTRIILGKQRHVS